MVHCRVSGCVRRICVDSVWAAVICVLLVQVYAHKEVVLSAGIFHTIYRGAITRKCEENLS
jgi:hypothetical protein